MTFLFLSFLVCLVFAPKTLNKLENRPTLFVSIVMFLFVFLIIILTGSVASAENRIRIAIIDTGVNLKLAKSYLCENGNIDFTGNGLTDVNGHGTNIAGILAKKINKKTHCLQIIKWYHKPIKNNNDMIITKRLINSLQTALKYKAKYVNMSMAGNYSFTEEKILLKELIKSGAKVFVAAGNEGHNLDLSCNSYPACYDIHSPNYFVVANYNNPTSNYARYVKWEDGNNVEGFGIYNTGTSQATAVYLSKQLQKDVINDK